MKSKYTEFEFKMIAPTYLCLQSSALSTKLMEDKRKHWLKMSNEQKSWKIYQHMNSEINNLSKKCE